MWLYFLSNKKKVVVLFDNPPPYGGVRVSSAVMFRNLQREEGGTYEPAPFDSSDLSEKLSSILLGRKVN